MKGISPVVSVTLLIAISIIGVMATWFWVSSYTSKPPLPETVFKGYTVLHAYLNDSGNGCNRLDLQNAAGATIDNIELYVKDYTTLKTIGANGTNPLNPAYINVTNLGSTSVSTYSISGLNKPFMNYLPGVWSTNDEGRSVAVDSQSNAILVGNAYDMGIIAKYDKYGTGLWNVSLNYTYLYNAAVDSSNNIIAVGLFNHSAGITNDVNSIIYVVKYNSAGAHQWNKTFTCGTGNISNAYAVTVDSSSNIVAAGGCWNASNGNSSYITIKMNSLGTEIWRNYTPVNNWGTVLDALIDVNNNFTIVTGRNGSRSTYSEIYTIKYNLTTGGFIWNNTYVVGGLYNTNSTYMGMALSSDNKLYLSDDGDQYTIRVVNASTGTSMSSLNTRINTRDLTYTRNVAIDKLGNILVTGWEASGKHCFAFFQKYTSNFTRVWSKWTPTNEDDYGTSIISDNYTDVYGTGYQFVPSWPLYLVKYNGNTGQTEYNSISIPVGAYFLKSNIGGYNTQIFRCPS